MAMIRGSSYATGPSAPTSPIWTVRRDSSAGGSAPSRVGTPALTDPPSTRADGSGTGGAVGLGDAGDAVGAAGPGSGAGVGTLGSTGGGVVEGAVVEGAV